MERRHMSDQQFQNLYDYHLPGLYRAALFITGNQEAAEQAAKKAFLHTALNRVYASDNRIFAVESAKLLYRNCKGADQKQYVLHPGFSSLVLATDPCQMTMGQRAVVAFSALGLTKDVLSDVLGLSRFAIGQYLSKFVTGNEGTPAYTARKFFSFTSL